MCTQLRHPELKLPKRAAPVLLPRHIFPAEHWSGEDIGGAEVVDGKVVRWVTEVKGVVESNAASVVVEVKKVSEFAKVVKVVEVGDVEVKEVVEVVEVDEVVEVAEVKDVVAEVKDVVEVKEVNKVTEDIGVNEASGVTEVVRVMAFSHVSSIMYRKVRAAMG